MAMNWLKGLVAPAAQYGAQQIAQQAVAQGGQAGPPIGGMQSPYGVSPGGSPQAPGPSVPGAMEWSVGTKTQGGAGGISGAPGGLEARCAQLEHDVQSLALFARTLLTMLEQKNVVTRAEFEETKRRLDMLDGKLDDR